MTHPKPLLVAMAAAGIVAVPLPVAHSVPAFVPELAAAEGAVCRPPIARPAQLVRLAAARERAEGKKTGISPAAPAAAAAAASARGDDPPLMDGLGPVSYRISTASEEAQRYFDQGVRLAWAFNHDEARRAFRKAQRLDPECAMCYWGEAWVLGPNINAPMDEQAGAAARHAAGRARALAEHATSSERALIAAMALRYAGGSASDRARLDARYAEAMREAAQRFPEDMEIALLYADALMNVSPWDYWEAGGARAKEAVAELVPALERVLQARPHHPGAIHLYIHAVEASNDPKRAERYADMLGKLAPRAGHLVHMPSHIYYRVGRYKDALAVNRQAVKVDEAYIAAEKVGGIYALGYYPHNVHFVLASAELAGDGPSVVEAARKLSAIVPDEAARATPVLQPMKAAPYFAHARFSDFETVMALPDPGMDVPYLQAVWHYARGVALAGRGEVAAARSELARIEHLLATADLAAFTAVNIPARAVMQIAAHVLHARIDQAKGDLASAVSRLEAAAKLYDGLPYMEPPYWPFPVRQTLGAMLVMQGDYERARVTFQDTLVRTPNNAWALYGLREAYARDGRKREAATVDRKLSQLWVGERGQLRLSRL